VEARSAAAEHAPQLYEPTLPVGIPVRQALAAPHLVPISSAHQGCDDRQNQQDDAERQDVLLQRVDERVGADERQAHQPAKQQQGERPAAERFSWWQPQVDSADGAAQSASRALYAIAEGLVFEATFRKTNDVVDFALEAIGRRRGRHYLPRVAGPQLYGEKGPNCAGLWVALRCDRVQ